MRPHFLFETQCLISLFDQTLFGSESCLENTNPQLAVDENLRLSHMAKKKVGIPILILLPAFQSSGLLQDVGMHFF